MPPPPTGTADRFARTLQTISQKHNYECRIGKSIPAAQKAYIHYGSNQPLKVEVSFRRRSIPEDIICVRNGYQVYTLNELARMKASAYSARDKIRDLYDVSFIVTHYWETLNQSAKDALRTALEYKSIEQFDYVIRTQSDELIDPEELETMFLESFDILDLFLPEDKKR